MANTDKKSIDKNSTDTKTKKEEAKVAAREFWANQRINQTDQPQPTQRKSIRM